MRIKDFTNYNKIVIVCHNIPDADTIGAGFALQQFLNSLGSEAVIIYGGWEKISKPSLLIMLEALEIEITYTKELPPNTDLLITVDCQFGAGNVEKYPLPDEIAICAIDHHRPEIPEGENTQIRPQLASCATLMWDLLRAEGCDIAGDYHIANALYYGLYTDTNGLAELCHPLDRDLAEIPHDAGLIRKLKNSAITAEELDIVGDMLKSRESVGRIGLFASRPCDPNLLGFSSDIAQQTAGMDCCITYSRQNHGLKLSIRSSAREIMANEIAAYLCRGVGNGGGNIEKAGGFIGAKEIERLDPKRSPEEYLRLRVQSYLNNYDHVYAGKSGPDFAAMPLYRKLPLRVGFAASTDIFAAKTKITIRTLEGDVDTFSDENIFLMIGILGEVYPIKRETFHKSYTVLDESFVDKSEYFPVIINRLTGEKQSILPYAKSCVPKGEKLVRAAELQKDTKVFTDWDTEKYFLGAAGDYIAANEGNFSDCYIVRRDIFLDSYRACDIYTQATLK